MPGSKTSERRMFSSLAIRDFRFLWTGTLASSFAMNIQQVARGWLVYEMTHSATQLSWVTLSFMMPQVFFALLGGALADRLPKKVLMMTAQGCNFVAACVMAYIIFSEQVTFWHFIYLGVFNGTVLALSMPSRQSMIPQLVGERQLMNAIALNSASMNLARILGPAAAGMLIAVFHEEGKIPYVGVGIVYCIIALLYATSVLSVSFLRVSGRTEREHRPSVGTDIIEGVSFMRNSPVVLGLVIMGTLPMMFGMPMQNLMPAFNRAVLQGGPDDLGLLSMFMGIGAIIGTLTLARLGDFRHKGRALFLGCFAWGVAIATFTTSNVVWLALPLAAFAALFSSSLMALNRTLMQLAAPPHMRGRIMSVDMMAHGLMPLGILPIGILGDHIGVQYGLLVSAALLLVVTAVCYVLLPAVRAIDTGQPDESMVNSTVNGGSEGGARGH